MALVNGAATSDRVNHGSNASLDNLNSRTWALWVYPTTLTASRYIMAKRGNSAEDLRFIIHTTTSELRLFLTVASGGNNYNLITSGLGFVVNKWQFIVATLNDSILTANIYIGDLSTIVAANGVSDTASASPVADSNNSLIVGNSDAFAAPFQGSIAWAGVWNRALSLGELRAQQFRPHVTAGCVLFTHYGFNGIATQPDWSGNSNSGVVTGATVGAHVPLGPAFVRSDDLAPYRVAAQLLNVSGAISPTGNLILQINKAIAGTTGPTGAIAYRVSTAYTGVVGPNGQPLAGVQTSLAGAVSPTGALATQVVTMLNVSGSVTPTGALVKRINTLITASTSPSSTLVKQIATSYTGVTGPSGQPILGAQTTFSGTLASSSVLTNQQVSPLTLLSVSGAISPTGTLTLVYVQGLTQDNCVSDYNMIEPTEVAATDLPTSKVHFMPSTV